MKTKSENTISRRRLLQLCGLGILAGGSGLNLLGCECYSGVPLAPKGSWSTGAGNLILSLSEIPNLQPVGGAVQVPLEGRASIIVAHVDTDDYLAFDNHCTHAGFGTSNCPYNLFIKSNSPILERLIIGEALLITLIFYPNLLRFPYLLGNLQDYNVNETPGRSRPARLQRQLF